jgi:predicted TIM-barrel fold metal-dependent hydrolase
MSMEALPFVDTHVHFYDLDEPTLRYSWLEPDGADIPHLGDYRAIKSRRYWAEDYIAETRFSTVVKSIHVQAAIGIEDPVEETRWLEASAERSGHPHGIVAFVDLARPDAAEIVARHAEHPRVRGIRDLRYDGYLSDPAWRRGYASLARHGLICCVDPLVEAMPAALELAHAQPDVLMCLDHASFPRRRDHEYFEHWRAGMRALAAVPSTVVKISGLGMGDHAWTVASLRPWVMECIELWGVERSFFGSNWPVDRLFSSYPDVIAAYRELIAGFSIDEQVALFAANAERIFRI